MSLRPFGVASRVLARRWNRRSDQSAAAAVLAREQARETAAGRRLSWKMRMASRRSLPPMGSYQSLPVCDGGRWGAYQVSSLTVGRCSPTHATSTRPSLAMS